MTTEFVSISLLLSASTTYVKERAVMKVAVRSVMKTYFLKIFKNSKGNIFAVLRIKSSWIFKSLTYAKNIFRGLKF